MTKKPIHGYLPRRVQGFAPLKARLHPAPNPLRFWFTCPRCGKEQVAMYGASDLSENGFAEFTCTNTEVCGEGNFKGVVMVSMAAEYTSRAAKRLKKN